VQFLIQRDAAYWQAVNAQVTMVTARVAMETAKYQAITARLQAETEKATLALTKAKLGTEDVQFGVAKYQLENLMPQQLLQAKAATDLANKQVTLVSEQAEAARAQTLDTRTDGSTVAGTVGSQKALYAQQVTSYQRDGETKAAKIFTDAWITMKTIDEGLDAPAGFTNDSVNSVLAKLKSNNFPGL
jgi:hypothetical protein